MRRFAILSLVLVFASLAFALQETKKEKPDKPVDKKEVKKGEPGDKPVEKKVDGKGSPLERRLAEHGVELSEEQKTKAKPIMERHERVLVELKQRMAQEERRYHEELMSILTEEQRAKLRDTEKKKDAVEGKKKLEGDVKKKPEGDDVKKKPEGDVKKKPEGEKKTDTKGTPEKK